MIMSYMRVELHRAPNDTLELERPPKDLQQLKLATALRSTLLTFSANRRLQRLSWKCDCKGLQQKIAKVFEFPPRLFCSRKINLDSRKGTLESPAWSFSITLERALKEELMCLVSFRSAPPTLALAFDLPSLSLPANSQMLSFPTRLTPDLDEVLKCRVKQEHVTTRTDGVGSGRLDTTARLGFVQNLGNFSLVLGGKYDFANKCLRCNLQVELSPIGSAIGGKQISDFSL
jgi:hypothetical protein